MFFMQGVASALLALIDMISIYYPVYFRLGYLRSNILEMIMYFATLFTGLLVALIRSYISGILFKN